MKRTGTAGLAGTVLLLPMLMVAAGCRTEPAPQTETPTPAAATAEPRSDSAISTAVQARFYTEDVTRGRAIEVSAEKGVVTLRGTVPSDAVRQRAVELARGVEGVTNVADQLEVRDAKPATATDSDQRAATGTAGRDIDRQAPGWITTKIQAQYFIDPDIKPWAIDVTTASGGVVTLEGTVDSAEDKSKAVLIARETEGVTRIEDRLRIEPARRPTDTPAATTVAQPDPWVTAKIQAKYFVDDDVKARNIDVSTQNGVVTLQGSVGTEAERRQAVAIARSTDGVRDVIDQLRLEAGMPGDPRGPGAGESGGTPASPAAERTPAKETDRKPVAVDRPDPWITMKIQSKYFLDADVKGRQIDVDTNDGVVTLKGTVDTAEQKQEAEQIARGTEGVKRVVNQLVIGTSGGL